MKQKTSSYISGELKLCFIMLIMYEQMIYIEPHHLLIYLLEIDYLFF